MAGSATRLRCAVTGGGTAQTGRTRRIVPAAGSAAGTGHASPAATDAMGRHTAGQFVVVFLRTISLTLFATYSLGFNFVSITVTLF